MKNLLFEKNILKLFILIIYGMLLPVSAFSGTGDEKNIDSLLFLGNKQLPPMVYIEDDISKGIVVDIVFALEKKMSRRINIKLMDWALAQKIVEQGGADALMQINETKERQKIFDFSDPLLESRFCIFTLTGTGGITGAEDLRHLKVGVEAKGLPEFVLQKDSLIKLVTVPGILEGFHMLKEGKLNVVVVDEWVGKYILAHNNINDVLVVGEPITILQSKIAVKKGNSKLLNDINKGLREIKEEGVYQKVLDKWKPKEVVFQTREQVRQQSYEKKLMVLFVVMTIVWVFLLMRQLSKRKKVEKDLRESQGQLKTVITNLQGVCFSVDKSGLFTFADGKVLFPLGLTPDQIPGLSLFNVYKDYPEFINGIKTALSGKQWTGETLVNEMVFDTFINPIFDIQKKIIGATCVANDITEHKVSEKKIKSLLAEKELTLKEVHHRMKNNMNTIKSILILQADSVKDHSAIAALEDAGSRVQSMMMLYDKLYQSIYFTEINVKDYLSSLVDEIIANFPNSRFVKIDKRIDEFILNAKRLQPLGIIINELLTNIMKYAFTDTDNCLITVSVLLKDNIASLVIEDNGKGMPESINFENSTGFGMHLVSILTEQIGGSIRVERGNGTKVILEFALRKSR